MNDGFGRRLGSALVVASALSGCQLAEIGENIYRRSGGIQEPTPAAVTRSIREFEDSLGSGKDAYSYAVAGMEKVRSDCHRYFDLLALLRRDVQTTRNQIAIVGGSTAAILGIVDATAKAIAIVAAGFAAADLSINNVQDNLLFVPVAEELKRLTNEAMQSYAQAQSTQTVLAQLKEISAGAGSQLPGDRLAARRLVGIYASFCTPSAIEGSVKAALARAKVTVAEDGVSGAGAGAAASALRQIALPPMDQRRAAVVAAFLRGGYLEDQRRKEFEKAFGAAVLNRAVSSGRLSDDGRDALQLFESARQADSEFRRLVDEVGKLGVAAGLASSGAAVAGEAARTPDAGATSLSLPSTTIMSTR